jgi:hypothetical protein
MANGAAFDEPARYQIRVKGVLDETWSTWFEGLAIIAQTNGETILAGPVADQAALHGLLVKIHNLGLPLLAVLREKEGET